LKSKENSDIVLVPQPADDPNDPLKWPTWKKTVAAVSVIFFAGFGGWLIGGIGSGIPLLIDEFGKDLNTTVDGVINWAVLTLGAGVKSPNLLLNYLEFFLASCGTLFVQFSSFLPSCNSPL
jgi:hypothetical protein